MIVLLSKLDPKRCQLEVMTQEGLQVFSLLVVMRVPKLDPERGQLGVTTPKWPSSLLTTYSRAGTHARP